MKRVGLRSSAFDELRHTDDFPKPVFITARTPAWLDHELEAWIAARVAVRDGKETT